MATNPNFSAHDLIPFARPEALTEPEKLLAAYFSSSSVGLCILDTELRYLALNQALAEFHGFPFPTTSEKPCVRFWETLLPIGSSPSFNACSPRANR
jgi:PAS domain-containing protein